MDKLSWRGFQSQKKPSLTGHSASHTHRPNTCQEIKKHTRATSRHPSAEGVIWICCWPRTASRCVTSVFPLFLSADQKGSMPTRNLSSRKPPCWKYQVSKINSVTQARRQQGWACEGRENLPLVHSAGREDPTPVKNTPGLFEVQKKGVFNTSSMSLEQIKWKNLKFHRGAAFDANLNHIRTRGTCVKSAKRPRCTVPAALLIAVDGGCAPAVKNRVR